MIKQMKTYKQLTEVQRYQYYSHTLFSRKSLLVPLHTDHKIPYVYIWVSIQNGTLTDIHAAYSSVTP